MRSLPQVVSAIALGIAAGVAGAAELSGFIAGEIRHFPHAPRFDDQFAGAQTTLILNPEIRWRAADGDRFALNPRISYDSRDSERSHTDLREAYWMGASEKWEWLAGINRVFWGVTESRHLVDIVNQTDAAAAFDGEEKLGQPMLNLTTRRDWGSLGLLLLPGFRERTFAGIEGRLRPGLPVDLEHPAYESAAEARHTDLAVRYTHYLGDWDIGLHGFSGTGREPRWVVDRDRLIPHYDQIRQIGLDLQYTSGAWLWKFEGLARRQHGERFTATVAGFEYTIYPLADSPSDLGLLAEYLHDGRDSNPALAPPTPFDDDLFLGTRFALNDIQDTTLLAGVIVDREDRSRLFSIEAERRLGSNWTIELEGRWFTHLDSGSDLSALAQDSFVRLRLARHI